MKGKSGNAEWKHRRDVFEEKSSVGRSPRALRDETVSLARASENP
jgi:hypothetical protein